MPPVADAYIRDGSFATTNFGADTSLEVKLSASVGFKRESYLKFDLSKVAGGVQDATLQLQTLTASIPGTNAVAFVTDNVWTENTITWATRPDSGAPLATWIPQAGRPALASITPLVQSVLESDRLLSLRLWATNITSDGAVTYGSRESGLTAPALLLTITNGSLLSATQSFWVTAQTPACPVLSAESLAAGRYRLTVNGDAGPDYIVLNSSNLLDWTTLLITNSPTLPFTWQDTDTNTPRRFYRVVLGP